MKTKSFECPMSKPATHFFNPSKYHLDHQTLVRWHDRPSVLYVSKIVGFYNLIRTHMQTAKTFCFVLHITVREKISISFLHFLLAYHLRSTIISKLTWYISNFCLFIKNGYYHCIKRSSIFCGSYAFNIQVVFS